MSTTDTEDFELVLSKFTKGTPTKYQPDIHPQMAYELCSKCFATIEQIAAVLQVGTATVQLWLRTHEEFKTAVEAGRQVADDNVEKSLYHRAVGGLRVKNSKAFNHEGEIITAEEYKEMPPDVAAAFIWLKNRRRGKWSDRPELAQNGDSGSKMQVIVNVGTKIAGGSGNVESVVQVTEKQVDESITHDSIAIDEGSVQLLPKEEQVSKVSVDEDDAQE